jgi:hypothetical protein
MLRGHLFTRNFLAEGITAYKEWNALTDLELSGFRERLVELFQDFPINGKPNETTTEKDVIEPILKAVGWTVFLAERITIICQNILEQARNHNWIVKEEQLDDRHIVRRTILKRCVYGLDKNPMAVEPNMIH